MLDIKFPRNPEEEDVPLTEILGDIAEAISAATSDRIPGQRELAKPPLTVPMSDASDTEAIGPKVVIDIDLRFRDLKAAVPIFSNSLSYVNNALIRPIVGFMK